MLSFVLNVVGDRTISYFIQLSWRAVWHFQLKFMIFRDVTEFPSQQWKVLFEWLFLSMKRPPVYRCFRDLFWRSAWDDPLFPSPVNMTLSLTPSRTMPPHVPGCGRATHSSLVPRTLPIASPWLSLRGCWVVLISIAWYMRVEGEYGGQKVQRGAFVSWG